MCTSVCVLHLSKPESQRYTSNSPKTCLFFQVHMHELIAGRTHTLKHTHTRTQQTTCPSTRTHALCVCVCVWVCACLPARGLLCGRTRRSRVRTGSLVSQQSAVCSGVQTPGRSQGPGWRRRVISPRAVAPGDAAITINTSLWLAPALAQQRRTDLAPWVRGDERWLTRGACGLALRRVEAEGGGTISASLKRSQGLKVETFAPSRRNRR